MNSSLRCIGRHWQTGSYRKNDRGEIMSDGMIYFDCDSCICGFIVDSNDCEYKGETTETNRKRKLE